MRFEGVRYLLTYIQAHYMYRLPSAIQRPDVMACFRLLTLS
jgi:hypothetical protein